MNDLIDKFFDGKICIHINKNAHGDIALFYSLIAERLKSIKPCFPFVDHYDYLTMQSTGPYHYITSLNGQKRLTGNMLPKITCVELSDFINEYMSKKIEISEDELLSLIK